MTSIKLAKSNILLVDALKRKQKSSPLYSQRSFARDLGVSPAFITKLLGGVRPLPFNRIKSVVKLLDLDSSEHAYLVKLLISESLKSNEAKQYLKKIDLTDQNKLERYARKGKSDFKLLSKWYNVVILDLISCSNFKNDIRWIARKIGISNVEAAECLTILEKENYIELIGDKYFKKEKDLLLSTGQTHLQIRNFHREMIKKAYNQLSFDNPTDVERRLITGFTIAAAPEKVEQLKSMILDFMGEASKFLSNGDCTEVYQLNLQLFPHTRDLKNG
ncbi:MAG: TIGR02147 family protein [Pseudobdellovibrionaceae bacterium]